MKKTMKRKFTMLDTGEYTVGKGKQGKRMSEKGRQELYQGRVSDKVECATDKTDVLDTADRVGLNYEAGMFLEQFYGERQVKTADYWSVFGELKQSTF